jgi:hypothetical protein
LKLIAIVALLLCTRGQKERPYHKAPHTKTCDRTVELVTPLQAAEQEGNRLGVTEHAEQFRGMHRCPAMIGLCVCYVFLKDHQ